MPKQVTDQDALTLNLEILGKLSRGDMLAAAGEDGKFVRKTNFLTQAWRKSETHDKDLFTQIERVLNHALDQIKVDPETPLSGKYIQALKGLEVLLSTYRSKGSKEFAYVEQTTLVLEAHNGAREPEPSVGKLIDLGKRAIHYVKDCRIRSNNNAFIYYGGGHSSRYFGFAVDVALTELLVRSDDAIIRSRDGRDVEFDQIRDAVLEIMRKPGRRRDKREQLHAKLNELLGDGQKMYSMVELLRHGVLGDNRIGVEIDPINYSGGSPSAMRIKAATNAIRMRFGNCGEKTCVAATWLGENTVGDSITIARVAGSVYDHEWVFISRDGKSLKSALAACESRELGAGAATFKHVFPRDTVVVDGWTEDCWGLRDWFNSVGNPRQLNVRRRIRSCTENGQIELREIVEWPPGGENSNFRLRFAHLAEWNWHGKKSASVSSAARQTILDEADLLDSASLISNRSLDSLCSQEDARRYATRDSDAP
jgi:hypothetical protein